MHHKRIACNNYLDTDRVGSDGTMDERWTDVSCLGCQAGGQLGICCLRLRLFSMLNNVPILLNCAIQQEIDSSLFEAQLDNNRVGN